MTVLAVICALRYITFLHINEKQRGLQRGTREKTLKNQIAHWRSLALRKSWSKWGRAKGVLGVERVIYVVQRAGKGESGRRVLHITSETTSEWLPPTRKMAAPLMEELSDYLGSPEPAVRLMLSILLGECSVSKCNIVCNKTPLAVNISVKEFSSTTL